MPPHPVLVQLVWEVLQAPPGEDLVAPVRRTLRSLSVNFGVSPDRRGTGFVLGDYFDFIGGTSWERLFATGLSLGRSVEKLTSMYRELGMAVFHKRKFSPLRAWSRTPEKMLGLGDADVNHVH
jgi:hypothetical protein